MTTVAFAADKKSGEMFRLAKTLEGASDHFSCAGSAHSGTVGLFLLPQSVLSDEKKAAEVED